jgi:hypothetical protein
MVDGVGPGNGACALACQKAAAGLLLLMRIELRLPAKSRSASLGGPPAIVGALDDPLPLVLGQSAQEGDET